MSDVVFPTVAVIVGLMLGVKALTDPGLQLLEIAASGMLIGYFLPMIRRRVLL